MMSNKLNVALVGAGYWGQKLLPKFSTARDAAVMMVCDIHEGNRAAVQGRFSGIEMTGSLDDVLSNRAIDAVVLATRRQAITPSQSGCSRQERTSGLKNHWRSGSTRAGNWSD